MRNPDPFKEMREGAQRYGKAQHDYWYEEGRYGREFDGRTWIGYYGWLDGKAASSATNQAYDEASF